MARRASLITKGTAASFGGVYFDDTETIVFAGATAPTNGTTGTGAGFAGKGSLYIDRTNGTLSQNTGTVSSPTWTAR